MGNSSSSSTKTSLTSSSPLTSLSNQITSTFTGISNKLSTNILTFGTSLNSEQLEELRVLTGLLPTSIIYLYIDFITYADSDNGTTLSLNGFYRLPFVHYMPLKEQLAVLYGYDTTEKTLTFFQFILATSQFTSAAPRDIRLNGIFRLYDADGDGRISKDDMLYVLSKSVSFEGSNHTLMVDPLMVSGGLVANIARRAKRETKLHAVVDRVFTEISSHPEKLYISKDDFFNISRQIEGYDHRCCIVEEIM